MGLWEALAILVAGMGAGAVNAVVGSGTLFTFPVLLAFGYPPVVATVSNSIGLAPGSLTSAIGYRRELRGQRRRIIRFGVMSFLGALTGAVALLRLPEDVFAMVVPVLIVGACVLVLLQPRINARLRRRRAHRPNGGALLPFGVYGAGVYGGYFAAAQGVILMGIMGSSLDDDMQRLNALKNALTFIVNSTAAVFYIAFAAPQWPIVALVAAGSVVGGYLGARFGRRLSPRMLRLLVVLIGSSAAVQILWSTFAG